MPEPTPASCEPHTFQQLHVEEHRHLDEILIDVAILTRHGSFVQAAKRFGEFRRRCDKHIASEERVVFPLFLEQSGDPTEIVQRLLEEHRRIGRLIDETAASISQWDVEHFGQLVVELGAVMKAHDVTESQVLHPVLDTLLKSPADWYRRCAAAGVDA